MKYKAWMFCTGFFFLMLCAGAESEIQMIAMAIAGTLLTIPQTIEFRKEEKRRERKDREELARYLDRAVRSL